MNIDTYIGKRAIFIESGQMCLVKIIACNDSNQKFTATCQADDSPGLSCELNVIRMQNEDAVKSWSNSPVFGTCWDLSVSLNEFHYEEDYWQASFLWGGGFRVFFHPTFIERFLQRDVTWLEEYFNSEDENSAEDDTDIEIGLSHPCLENGEK